MVNKLVSYLEQCDKKYYETSDTLVSDRTYDAMVEMLRRLNPEHPYLKKVGAKVKSGKVGRVIPMGTLSKCHKDEEILKWLESERESIILAPKYDGFAVELWYDGGRLVAASTRGDGHVGEDVLLSMMKVRNVPLTIDRKDSVIIRGEAIIPTKNHDQIKSLGYTAMRNAVPGIVRSNRSDALSYVDFIAYEFIDGSEGRGIQREYWKDYFTIEDYRIFNWDDFEGIKARRDELRASEYTYELDGVVLKTDSIKEDDLMNPSHMIAWKYKSNRETTILRGIEYQLGVTGYFTPIGIFDPVEFQGATLTRASLGNMTRLAKEFEGLTIGSVIEVSRRGDIIPYIEEVVFINEDGDPLIGLDHCPHCGESLMYEDYEPHCINKGCPEKLRLQITQYAKSLGVKGIGDKLIKGLIDSGHIHSITDIYRVKPEVILTLPRQGNSAADKWQTLRERKLTVVELLSSYPFIDLGKKVWEAVYSKFNSYNEILNLTEEDLLEAKIRGIGDSKIKSIVSQVKENKEELEWLGHYHGVL